MKKSVAYGDYFLIAKILVDIGIIEKLVNYCLWHLHFLDTPLEIYRNFSDAISAPGKTPAPHENRQHWLL